MEHRVGRMLLVQRINATRSSSGTIGDTLALVAVVVMVSVLVLLAIT